MPLEDANLIGDLTKKGFDRRGSGYIKTYGDDDECTGCISVDLGSINPRYGQNVIMVVKSSSEQGASDLLKEAIAAIKAIGLGRFFRDAE